MNRSINGTLKLDRMRSLNPSSQSNFSHSLDMGRQQFPSAPSPIPQEKYPFVANRQECLPSKMLEFQILFRGAYSPQGFQIFGIGLGGSWCYSISTPPSLDYATSFLCHLPSQLPMKSIGAVNGGGCGSGLVGIQHGVGS